MRTRSELRNEVDRLLKHASSSKKSHRDPGFITANSADTVSRWETLPSLNEAAASSRNSRGNHAHGKGARASYNHDDTRAPVYEHVKKSAAQIKPGVVSMAQEAIFRMQGGGGFARCASWVRKNRGDGGSQNTSNMIQLDRSDACRRHLNKFFEKAVNPDEVEKWWGSCSFVARAHAHTHTPLSTKAFSNLLSLSLSLCACSCCIIYTPGLYTCT
jgi:hypothetical protein